MKVRFYGKVVDFVQSPLEEGVGTKVSITLEVARVFPSCDPSQVKKRRGLVVFVTTLELLRFVTDRKEGGAILKAKGSRIMHFFLDRGDSIWLDVDFDQSHYKTADYRVCGFRYRISKKKKQSTDLRTFMIKKGLAM